MMTLQDIEIDDGRLVEFCRRHGIAKLSLFGSALHAPSLSTGDIDLLVEFQRERRVSLFDVGGMVVELREMFGRDVDLRTAEDLSPHFRSDVLKGVRLIYAA